MAEYNECPECGKLKERRSKRCIQCHEKKDHDEYTPYIRQAYFDNLAAGVPRKTLAKRLAESHPKLSDLKWQEIVLRLHRIEKKHLSELKDKLLKKRDFLVVGTPADRLDGAELWRQHEEKTEEYLEKVLNEDSRLINIDTDLPIGVVFLADMHVGARGTALRQMRLDAELIRNTTGLYAILGGDGWDNHIKHLAAIIASDTTPSEQIKMFAYYLSIFEQKILAMISGNHEAWTKALAGIDVVQHLAQQRAIVYSKDGLKITLRVGLQDYRIYIRHKTRFNSPMNPSHTIKRLYDYGDWPFDVGVRGDEHEANIEKFRRHGQQRWAVRVGSYQAYSDFAEIHGFPRANVEAGKPRPLCPTLIFYPNERRIDGFDNLHDAVEVLAAVRAARERELNKKKLSSRNVKAS
jgi:hypothetical protein